MSQFRTKLAGIVILVLLAPGAVLHAPAAEAQWVHQERPTVDDTPQTIDSEEEAIDQIQDPFSHEDHPRPDTGQMEGEDECDWHLKGEPWQEQSQEVVRSFSCHSFRWFDGLWGDSRDFPENAVNGLVLLGTRWRQYDGFDPRFRFKVRAPLPNLDNKFDLVLGRVDEEAFISDTDTQDRMFYNPGIVTDREESWLLGLGHRRKGKRSGWDTSLGLRLSSGLRLYGKLQYYYNKHFTENLDLRLRQTFFWRDDDGLGSTSRGDLAWGIDLKNVVRWEALGRISQKSEGTEWRVGQTWYHLFGDRNAFSLLTYARGKTGADVPLQDAGFVFNWRRPFTRDWMYLSMGPTITWPREQADEKREVSFGFNLWLEMEFGNWRY
jgi:hypothetical protein